MRRDGNKVRINAQLIDAERDEHIWAKDFNRDWSDVFTVQKEVAEGIGKELLLKSISALKKSGIEKIHIMVYKNNT